MMKPGLSHEFKRNFEAVCQAKQVREGKGAIAEWTRLDPAKPFLFHWSQIKQVVER